MQIHNILIVYLYIMNKIGFKNFRRFNAIQPLELKGITFLVGQNNSGKSTLAKALILVNNYFKSSDFEKLNFNDKKIADINIRTFGRAKYATSEDNFIKLCAQKNDIKIALTLTGEYNDTFAKIVSLNIHDLFNSIQYNFNFLTNILEFKVIQTQEDKVYKEVEIEHYENLILDLEVDIKKLDKSSKEYIEQGTKLSKIKLRKKELLETLKNTKNINFEIERPFEKDKHNLDLPNVIQCRLVKDLS